MQETSYTYIGEGDYALERRTRRGRKSERPWRPGSPKRLHMVEKAERRAKALGWLSIGLGFAEIFACRSVARAIGLRDDRRTRKTLVGLGVREIATGIGILVRPRPAGFVWGRVIGDLIDLALLSKAPRARKAEPERLAGAAAAIVGVTLVDTLTAVELSQRPHRGVSLRAAITVNRSPEEVYRFWHDFENLPRFMSNLESVEVQNGTSRWRAKALAGAEVEWEADLLIDRPNEMIAWQSREDSEIQNAGSVRFKPAPGGRGTEVSVKMDFDPPGGAVGAAIGKLFGKIPEAQLEQDLRRFKQVLEVGEVVQSDASIHHGRHPARPSTDEEIEKGYAQ